MTATSDLIQKLYIGYFGRAGDPSGLQYWVERKTAGMSDAAIAQSFSVQTEATNMYGYLAAPSLGMGQDAFLESVYQNLFERSIEAGGLTYWKGQLASGRPVGSIILDIINGAVGSDATTVANKLSVANYYTEKVISTNATWTLADDQVDAISVIANVTSDTATVTTGKALADALIAADTATPPQTFTLTAGANNFTGGSGADVFDGGLTSSGTLTFQGWDSLNGGAGNDTLNASMNANTVTATNIASIETLNLDVSGASASTLNMVGESFVTAINVTDSAGLTVSSLGSLPAVRLSGTGATTLDFTAAALAPSAQTLAITLDGKTAGAVTITDNGSSALETISITSTGAANTIGGLTTSALGTTTLTVAGDRNVTLGALTDANSTLRTIDASTLTGNLSVTAIAGSTVTGGTGNDTITSAGGNDSFVGGAGDDTFVQGTNLTTADTISGGDGASDIVSTTVATANGLTSARTTETITGVEILTISDAAAAATFNSRNVAASINTVRFDAGTAGADGITGAAGAFAVRIGNGTAGVLGGALTVTDTGTATTDSLTLTLNGANSTNAGAGMAVTSTGYETLTVSTNTSDLKGAQTLGAVIVTPDTNGTGNLTVTGANALTVGVVTATGGTIDASGLTMTSGNGLVMIAGANTATTIIGGGGNDTLFGDNVTDRNTSITSGAGADSITSYGGNDTISSGDGNDTITSGTGNDSIDAGAGNDTVQFVTAALTRLDTVVGGDGTDTLSYTTFTAASANDVDAQQQVSGFETLRVAGITAAGQALTMSNYVNNTGFTILEIGTNGAGASGLDIGNASATLNTVRAVGAVAGTHTFDRLTDTSSNSLTISNNTSGAGAAATFTAFQALDEETITLTASAGTTAGSNDLTITTLTVADLVTLNLTSASDSIITNAIVGASNLTTVNASTATGAVTVSAANAGGNVTMTGNSSSTGVVTFTGGAFNDSITGGAGADVLGGGIGKDTISGGAGADNITGGAGADSLTGGSGADTFTMANLTSSVAVTASSIAGATLAAGDTLTFGNGLDIITDFAAGTGGDILENGAAVVAAIASGLGENVTNGFATATTTYYISGNYSGGIFTVTADGVGSDTLVRFGDAAPTALTAATSMVLLVGVDTDNLLAGNFS